MTAEELKIMQERNKAYATRIEFLRRFTKGLYITCVVLSIFGILAMFIATSITGIGYLLLGALGFALLILASYIGYVNILVHLDHVEAAELTLKEIQDYKYKDIIVQGNNSPVETEPSAPSSEENVEECEPSENENHDGGEDVLPEDTPSNDENENLEQK